MSLHPVHLTANHKHGQIPPSALVPFCSYQSNSSLLGQQVYEKNMTICDKFEPTLFDGKLCYSLDVAKLSRQSTKAGQTQGLSLLIDPYPDHLGSGNKQKGSEPQPFEMYIHTLEEYTANEVGAYAMRNLKRMTATDNFVQLPDLQKRCQVHNIVECQTKQFLDRVKGNCNCIPWALITKNTGGGDACGPDMESCVAEQKLRDESCLVPCAGLYADITEENFLLQLRQKSKKTKNVEDGEENLRILTEKYTNYKQDYVKQLWFDPTENNLSNVYNSPNKVLYYINFFSAGSPEGYKSLEAVNIYFGTATFDEIERDVKVKI